MTAISAGNMKTGDSDQETDDPAFDHPMAKNSNVVTITKGHGLEISASTTRTLIQTRIRRSRISFPNRAVGAATSQTGCVIATRTMRNIFPWSAVASLRPRLPVIFSWSRCGLYLRWVKVTSMDLFDRCIVPAKKPDILSVLFTDFQARLCLR